jgi:diaminopimelate epimerase
MTLFKAHGLGNDYLVWEGGGALSPERVVALCDRHRGVGADGVLEPVGALGVRIWNPDGSVAEKSGNGLRIFAWWLHVHRGAPDVFTVQTADLSVDCEVVGREVAVEMGRAEVGAPQSLEVDGALLAILPVNVGNPHCVVFREEPDLDRLPWRRWGEVLEVHPAFPNRTNVQVARVVGPAALNLRVWERGAGPTLASGSSACAVAAAAVHTGRVAAGPLTVEMQGGTLSITARADGTLRMTGPVAPVGRFTLDPGWGR